MFVLSFLLLHTIATIVYATPPQSLKAKKFFPSCYAERPYCIRPRALECRDAIFLMSTVDPGYPILLGRKEFIEGKPRAFAVPRKWGSIPDNCVVKLDMIDEKATEEVRLESLVSPADLVVRTCILKGSGCGGSVLVGPGRNIELSVAYYTAVASGGGVSAMLSNLTYLEPSAMPLNGSHPVSTS